MKEELPKSFAERMAKPDPAEPHPLAPELARAEGKLLVQLIHSQEHESNVQGNPHPLLDLSILISPGHAYHGWLFYRHPDPEKGWCTVRDLKKFMPLLRS